MRRRHVAVFTLPAKAHIYPVLGICRELIKRGYRVTFATTENVAQLVRQEGIEPVIFNPGPGSEVNFGSWPARDPQWWKFIADQCLAFTRDAALAVAQLEPFYRANPPDATIYDNCAYAGRIISKHMNSASVQFFTVFARGKFISWEGGVGRNPEPMLEFVKQFDSFLSAYGFEGSGLFWHSADLNISPMPRALQYEGGMFDSRRFCFVGPCLRSFTNSWKGSSNGGRSILVSDMAGLADVEYFSTIVAALSGSKYNVILSVGENFPVERLLPLPENFELNEHVSHLEILQHVDLLIYSGGPGGALEALFFGVPIIALPRWPPEEVVAYRIDQLGLGVSLPRHSVTPEIIRDNVARVLGDDAIGKNVRHMQDLVRNSGGAIAAVDKIEETLRERA